MAIERNRISAYVNQLPTPDYYLFGNKPSSADVVTAVLFGRLKLGGVPSYVEQYQATQEEVLSPPKLFFILPG